MTKRAGTPALRVAVLSVALLVAMLASLGGKAEVAATDRCATKESTWSDQETWAWRCTCAGKIADFDQRDGRQIDLGIYPAGSADRNICRSAGQAGVEGGLDARRAALPGDRVVTPAFVETVLFREPYRTAMPNVGLRIRGALFKEPLQLASGQLAGALSIENSRFQQHVDMTALRSTGTVSFRYSIFLGEFVAETLSVARLDLTSAVFWQKVNLDSARVTGPLIMHGAHIKCDLWADSVSVDGNAYLRDGARFDRITRIRNAKIGLNLYLDRSHFFRVDLSGSRIQGELNVGFAEPRNRSHWKNRSEEEPSLLLLRNTSAGTLLGLSDSWPTHLNLEGFTYGHIRIDDKSRAEMDEWGTAWLKRSPPDPGKRLITAEDGCASSPYEWRPPGQFLSFHPYRQFADAIVKAGLVDEADAVLFAGRERERAQSTGWKFATMTLSSYLVGYGYGWRYFFALVWATLLVGIAYVLIKVTGENEKQAQALEKTIQLRRYPPVTNTLEKPQHLGLLFCVDMLIPLIQFNRKHYEVTLRTALVRRYFIVHRVLGYVLGSFVIAGLAGLTK